MRFSSFACCFAMAAACAAAAAICIRRLPALSFFCCISLRTSRLRRLVVNRPTFFIASRARASSDLADFSAGDAGVEAEVGVVDPNATPPCGETAEGGLAAQEIRIKTHV